MSKETTTARDLEIALADNAAMLRVLKVWRLETSVPKRNQDRYMFCRYCGGRFNNDLKDVVHKDTCILVRHHPGTALLSSHAAEAQKLKAEIAAKNSTIQHQGFAITILKQNYKKQADVIINSAFFKRWNAVKAAARRLNNHANAQDATIAKLCADLESAEEARNLNAQYVLERDEIIEAAAAAMSEKAVHSYVEDGVEIRICALCGNSDDLKDAIKHDDDCPVAIINRGRHKG